MVRGVAENLQEIATAAEYIPKWYLCKLNQCNLYSQYSL